MFTRTRPVRFPLQRITLLAGVSVIALAHSAWSQSSGFAVSVPAGENTERAPVSSSGALGAGGFSISLDGEAIAGAPPPPIPQRRIDRVAAAADVDVRFDGLGAKRLLNVSTADLRHAYRAGETVRFRTSMNYPAYVTRTEVRVLDRTRRGNPVVATLPTAPNGTVDWVMPNSGADDLSYVVRTYDARGRYDETMPLALTRTEQAFETHATTGAPFVAAGEGESRLRLRNIPVNGGMITASGTGARAGGTAVVMGESVPVDDQGRFVVSRIVPAGDQIVTVDVNGKRILRDVNIPENDWFYVGLAEATFGKRKDRTSGESDSYSEGRLAGYAKGRTRGGYRVTASVDTGNGPLDEIFERLNDKDPRRVLDRLRENDDDLYPTYGDDSTIYDDTPTQGRVYLRVENDTLRFTWGNYTAGINNGGLLNNTRDLYGAEVRYTAPNVTANGDARYSLQAYVASPDTAVQRDILRGTGGSIYFLTRRDITGGSLNLSVQVIDPDTGRVVSTRALVDGVDYRIDHIQGVLILTQPLGSATGDGTLVSEGIGRFDQNLVAQYEYTPTAGTDDATSYGGRAEAWVTDRLRFGITLMNESTATDQDQRMSAIDLRYRLSEESYAELELARTSGPGIARSISTDGGLTISSSGGTDTTGADALRFDSHFALGDLGLTMPGYLDVYYERKEAGFSTLTEDITSDQTLFGLKGQVEVNDQLSFAGFYETFERDSGDQKDSGELSASYKVNDIWTLGVAVAHIDQTVVGDATRTGKRTDAAVRLSYAGIEDLTLYGYVQGTLDHSGGLERNNRAGLGFDAQLTEKLSASGEFSDGDLGSAGAFRLSYAASADNEYYLGYELDPTADVFSTSASDNGTVVIGGRHRLSETVTTFAENKYDLPGQRQSLTEAYGVTYTPSEAWTIGASLETGDVRDREAGDFDRTAVSLGTSYAQGDDVTARLRLEYSEDDGVGTAQDRETFGVSASYANQVNPDWRFVSSLDALYSDSAEGDFRDGEYLKFQLGYAYRPVDNERLNMLFRYTLLNDLPGEDQVTANGSINGPSQRSHVLSFNGSYDVSKAVTASVKLGYRKSEIAARGSDVFTDSTASLAALRFDWHIVHKWDAFAEGRYTRTDEAELDETSALIGIYRHVGNNAKIGIGYEWGSVSDDLTNLDYDNEGLFINLIAKF